MMNLPITINHIAELLLNDAIRKKYAPDELIPVVKLVVSNSTISVLLAAIDQEHDEIYGLFFMPNAQPKLSTMKIDDFIRLSEYINKPICLDEEWSVTATIGECYQQALAEYESPTVH